MPLTTQQVLNVNIPEELTLTPFTGASLINEILKGLLYQKSQIPFPYGWLKMVVEKRRKMLAETVDQKLNFRLENHFRVVSKAYDCLDVIMKGVTKEFCEGNNTVKEIILVFGPSANCPKEVFTIVIPSVAKGHIEKNHLSQLDKHLQKVLRNLFLSQSWMDSIDASTSCTNTFIYLKKEVSIDNCDVANEAFELCQPLHIPANLKHSRFNLSYSSDDRANCCRRVSIFDESGNASSGLIEEAAMEAGGQVSWYRSKEFFKGFKDCFVNNVSICSLW